MSQPQVSVIIPTYNCDRYLAEAIDSVLAQTYQNLEIIVINDGSTDRTAEVLQRYDDRIQAIHQRNQGVACARNHGIAKARGQWIAFLDADDIFLPTKLAAQVDLATRSPTLGIIHSGWQRVDSQGRLLAIIEPWRQIPQLTLESWLRWKPVLPSAMLFRRDWLERSGGFDSRFPPAEDTELVLRLAAKGCIAEWLPQVTVSYRQHESSAMHQGLPQARSLLAVIDHFFAQPDLPESIRWIESQIRYSTIVWIAWYLYHTGYFSGMAEHLQRSWSYSPYSPTETIVHWADSFSSFSQHWGGKFDAERLHSLTEWQALLQWMAGQIA